MVELFIVAVCGFVLGFVVAKPYYGWRWGADILKKTESLYRGPSYAPIEPRELLHKDQEACTPPETIRLSIGVQCRLIHSSVRAR